MTVPLVAIIGRANVGKSTLFNKLVRKKKAIVNDTSGVTRDRMYDLAEWLGKSFLVIDTGGIDAESTGEMDLKIKEQARLAVDEADAIIFVVDGQDGVTYQDREVITQIRKSQKPFFLAVNKIDHFSHEQRMYEFSELGMDAIYPISAEHGQGLDGLMTDVVGSILDKYDEAGGNTDIGIKIAIIGKPNAGKSSMVNNLLKSERCIVSAVPGTTRDSVDSELTYNDKKYVLIDTAGIRRKGRTPQLLDKYSVIMALKAMERSDVTALVLDAETGISDQDATIAGYAFERGRACVVVINKWDLIKDRTTAFNDFKDAIKYKLKFLDFSPIVSVSAKTGQGMEKFLSTVDTVYHEYSKEIATSKLNSCFEAAIKKNPFSQFKGKLMRLYYSTQVKKCPPTFRCFVNHPDGIHFSYQRYLTNSLRKEFGFQGTPVRLEFVQRRQRT